MGKGTLTIYSASAGSGKTYKLTGIYLSHLFKSRYNYRRILAVTFTNKATAEMKARILEHLDRLARGEDTYYLGDLRKSTGKDESWIRKEAAEILNCILHDFTRFSVSTIDSFFQKVLRSFAREAGLHPGFNIELDNSTILSTAIDEMISKSSDDRQLLNWLLEYARRNIEEEKSWNLKEGITKLARELFKEKFKILSEGERANLENKEFLLNYIHKLSGIKSGFESVMLDFGKEAMKIFLEYKLTDDMFYQKKRGIPDYIRNLNNGKIREPNTYVTAINSMPPKWSSSSMDARLQQAIDNGFEKMLKETLGYYFENIINYNTALAILSNIYALGIFSDVLHNVHAVTSFENTFLLSDAGDVLNLITAAGQSPFIYEKIGSKFENYMIDEFQDTSRIQWSNFSNLVENSMAEGFDNLVVGDVKQAIYRWRNSDWRILGQELDSLIDNDRYLSEPLAVNWRSRSNIIAFNNKLFTLAPQIIDERLSESNNQVNFSKLYSEAVQHDPGINPGGFIRMEFLKDDDEKTWKEIVLERLPGIIESVQDRGYKASDIGIIVRESKEGALILRSMIEYSNSCEPDKLERYNYNLLSNDSLLLSNSPVICFIISVLTVVNNTSDMINRAAMLRMYLLAKGEKTADSVPLVNDELQDTSRKYFPEGYEALLDKINQYTLFEAIENIIGFFDLGSYPHNVAYLNTFQDYVIVLSGSKYSDINAFLEWWETTGSGKSVVLPEDEEAIRVLTIHKSKGLEFKIVILPFISWQLDHPAFSQPFLWIRPPEPFDELGIVPIRYGKALNDTLFKENYLEERYSVFLDNINLLYVALTRTKDALFGFSPSSKNSDNTIAGVLKIALSMEETKYEERTLVLSRYFNNETQVFEYGEIPDNKTYSTKPESIFNPVYPVHHNMGSLRLKLHGENYFSSESRAVREKINYGKLMHEIFEGINTLEDIEPAVKKLVLEGKLPGEESVIMTERVKKLIARPEVSGWFMSENEVMTEAGILLKTGTTRRPDRVIFRDGRTIVIDFKFGEEHDSHIEQVDQYRRLLSDMGYDSVDAFIWYVDKNKVISI